MLDKIKKLSCSKNFYISAFLFVMIIGIFLRTYKFGEWLQFGPDQARDATLIENALIGKIPFPLSGPQAGNTHLNMGPLYYHWQYLSVLVFGASPESMAYPSLLFSILAIPLFFLLVNKFFDKKISLAITALLAISFFAIVNSRFASNPNSIPFFVFLFLYSILELASEKKNSKIFWAAMVGISVGAGIQLHALLIFIMPAVLGIIAIYLLIKKKLKWKSLILIVFFFLLLNTGQIFGELESGWKNLNYLIFSVNSKSQGNSLLKNISLVFACQIQANAHIISSVENLEECGSIYQINEKMVKNKKIYHRASNNAALIIQFIFVVTFSLVGYFLLGYFIRKEKDTEKKNFLQLIALYNAISFLVLIPVVTEVSVRYFIVLIFVPFVLFGLWVKFLLDKERKIGMISSSVFFASLVIINLFTIFNATALYRKGQASDSQNSILGEINLVSDYIIANSNGFSKYNFVGKSDYLHRFGKPIAYLTKKYGKEMVKSRSDKELESGMPTFFIVKNDIKGEKYIKEIKKHVVTDAKNFGNIRIYVLEKLIN
jgi:4-amino-4-deoxy-L-arabinose transferase-like glycosyltransferase